MTLKELKGLSFEEFKTLPLNQISPGSVSKLPQEWKNHLFIRKAKEIHGDKYDYSQVVYKEAKSKLTIVCPLHGEFKQSPNKHLMGRGCLSCGKERSVLSQSYDTEEFVEKARGVHGDKYDYNKVEYEHSKKDIVIVCPLHGGFKQHPNNHLNGQGCPVCGKDRISSTLSHDTERFIRGSKEVHGNKYDYSMVEYNGNKEKVQIICPHHGEFKQSPNNHLSGKGCSVCGNERMSSTHRVTFQDFDNRFNKKYNGNIVHGVTEEWWDENYVNGDTKVLCHCPIHNNHFNTSVVNLLHPNHCLVACPLCSGAVSNPENEVRKYVDSLAEEYREQKGKDITVVSSFKLVNTIKDKYPNISSREIDIYIPELKLGFEYNGLRYHDEKAKGRDYHQEKSFYFRDNGVRLIHIWEDQWLSKQSLVKSFIRNKMELASTRVFARKCMVKTIRFKDVKEFLNRNHFQGAKSTTLYYGLYYNDKLLQTVTFLNNKTKGYWEVDRFATEQGYSIVGGFSKIMKAFLRDVDPHTVFTYSSVDVNNIPEQSVYASYGFRFIKHTPSSYFYYNVNDVSKRIPRVVFQKHKCVEMFGLQDEDYSTLSERGMTSANGFFPFYDSGNYAYVLKRTQTQKTENTSEKESLS